MDWDEYKALCDRPNVFSRWMLEQTGGLVNAVAAEALRAFTARAPLVKPADHKGGAVSDMFEIDLEAARVREIVEHLERARAAGRTTPQGRPLGGFVAAWVEYRDWIG